MRVIALIVASLFVIWLFSPKIGPLKPDARIRTFAQLQADGATLRDAAAAGRLHEDPTRHALRQAIIVAGNRLEASPCDNRLRQKLREAVADYLHNRVATQDQPIETYPVADGVADAARYFDEPVQEVIAKAAMAGIATPGVFGGVPAGDPGGSYACDNG